MRQQTIINPSPVPLYCSDECHLANTQSVSGLDINYDSECPASPTLTAMALPRAAQTEDSSYSSIGSSAEAEGSSPTLARAPSPTTLTQSKRPSGPIAIGYAALASIHVLPPLPPPPPPFQPDPKPEPLKYNAPKDYTSGVMIAARRIQAVLGPHGLCLPPGSGLLTPTLPTRLANRVSNNSTRYLIGSPGHALLSHEPLA